MGKYIIRLDDIAPNMHWGNFQKIKSLFLKYNIKPIIGVIPDNQDPVLKKYQDCGDGFWEEIRKMQNNGWNIALHGYQHIYDSDSKGILGINPRSEFAGHPYEIQFKKIRNALNIFEKQHIKTVAFMAPSHSFDYTTIKGLVDNGINSITDGYGLAPFWKKGVLFVPQLFATPRKFPIGVYTFCLHLNTMEENEIKKIEQFIVDNKQDIISYSDAEYFASNSILNQLSIVFFKYILKFSRAGRKVIRSFFRGKMNVYK